MDAKTKVLVVDDDPVIAKSFDRVLSGKGYAVITAANGTEALEKIAHEDYDMVFTDIKMPGMDGVEVARRIKAERPWLPVVIVTGYGSDANEARAKEAGVANFLRKPLSPEMIAGSAQAALLEKVAPTAPEPAAAPAAVSGKLKNIALFFAAPFIGLAYALALPFIGLGILGWVGYRALVKKDKAG